MSGDHRYLHVLTHSFPTRRSSDLLRLAPPADNTLIALYGITRGNRKAYLHVEQFEANASLGSLLPTSATLLRQLKDTGVLDLPRLVGEPDETWLRQIGRAHV